MKSIVSVSFVQVVLLVIVVAAAAIDAQEVPSPVIVVPGVTGSRVQIRITQRTNESDFYNCPLNQWIDPTDESQPVFANFVPCWLAHAKRDVNILTGLTSQPDGIEARIPIGVDGIGSKDLLANYLQPLLGHLESLGLKIDESLLVAPYDWRLIPRELDELFQRLLNLIAAARQKFPTKKVTLICHSYGCQVTLIFLRRQTADFREANIRKLVAFGAPFGGTSGAVAQLLVGQKLSPALSEREAREIIRTWPSFGHLLPQPLVFTGTSPANVLVRTPLRIYTALQINLLLTRALLLRQNQWLTEAILGVLPLSPLNDLAVACLYGLEKPTQERLTYQSEFDFPDTPSEKTTGPGDAVVNSLSLKVCSRWARDLPNLVNDMPIAGVNHFDVLSNSASFTFLTGDLQGDD